MENILANGLKNAWVEHHRNIDRTKSRMKANKFPYDSLFHEDSNNCTKRIR
jgi:hypothetical protein